MSGSPGEHLPQSEGERRKNTTLLSTPMDLLPKIFSAESQPFLYDLEVDEQDAWGRAPPGRPVSDVSRTSLEDVCVFIT